MGYKTYVEQIQEHLRFLDSLGLEVAELDITESFVRCRSQGQINGRGEGCYRTTQSRLANGTIGLLTWARVSGTQKTYKSYGLPPSGDECLNHTQTFQSVEVAKPSIEDYEKAAKRAYGVWINSAVEGESPYLLKKNVGAFGIRFKDSPKYGKALIVPLRDVEGKLWSYQVINEDRSKRFPKGARVEGLFHALKPLIDGQPIGVAESYATAASCMVLSGIACVCCCGSSNIKPVAEALLRKYPASKLVLFADNDRHSSSNQGVSKARQAQKLNPDRITVAIPDFGDLAPARSASDWNDLCRLKGAEACKRQLVGLLPAFR